jgi:hypothetical protein
MRARIKERREVAKGTLLVTFDLLGGEVDFSPTPASSRGCLRMSARSCAGSGAR